MEVMEAMEVLVSLLGHCLSPQAPIETTAPQCQLALQGLLIGQRVEAEDSLLVLTIFFLAPIQLLGVEAVCEGVVRAAILRALMLRCLPERHPYRRLCTSDLNLSQSE